MHGANVVLIACFAAHALAAGYNKSWRSSQQEALDEIHDRELLKAVQQSVREWETSHQAHQSRKKRAVKRVCYNELGCFDDSGPFSYLEMLPAPPEEINTSFYFYSTKNRSDQPLMELPFLNMTAAFAKKREERSENVTVATVSKPLARSSFTVDDLRGLEDLSVRVIVHGFGSACPHVWIYEMKTALMAVEDCIVICVDWANGATFPNYVKAAANTRLVGKQVAMLIQNLKEHKGLDLAKTHLIGFSLGAHVSGFAGAELPGLSRITGLDPAGPLFEAQHPKVRLDSTDANFVDVIHSNGENLILGGLGSWQPMGHVDFYPNGGRVQTGCSNLFVGAVTDFIWSQTAEDEEGRSLCNHRRAYKFFIDSVAPRCQFPAFPCNSYDDFLKGHCFPCSKYETNATSNGAQCGNMGYYADRSTGRGQLYLVTREEEPFCAHQFQIQIFNSFNDLPLRTIGRLEATLEGEGGLNETFLISEKDDTEFFAGDIVSKIIVPHPALGFPTSLSLQYKSYSGWLSKGLPHWDIDKVLLTDSFGRSHSFCKAQKLSSGSPVHFKLNPGNCEIPNEDDYGTSATEGATDKPATDGPGTDSSEETIKRRKDELGLDSTLDRKSNNSKSQGLNDSSTWHLEGNSLDKEIGESSRSLSKADEIFEPVLKDRRLAVNKGRNLQTDESMDEIVEPLLRSTTPRQKKLPRSDGRSEASKANSSEPLTVQLLPFRLSELFERAERYAKETLLPLISVQAPRFFNLGSRDSENREERKPRYIPRVEEERIRRQFARNATVGVRKSSSTHVYDLVPEGSTNHRNIFELMHNRKWQRSDDTQSFNEVAYYANDMTESRALKPLDDVLEMVHIDLPTYRPAVRKQSERKRLQPPN